MHNLGILRYQDTYRSKLSGILHMIKIVENMVSKFNITEGSITVVCNGLDAISMAYDKHSYFTCQSNHLDILTEINNST